jgi:hypothetical protein
MNAAARIPLDEGLRLYWRHLVPITVLPTVIICVMGLSQKAWTFWFILPFFYGCGYYAAIPYSKKNVTYWFWVLACVLWVLGAIPGVLVFAVLKKLIA